LVILFGVEFWNVKEFFTDNFPLYEMAGFANLQYEESITLHQLQRRHL